MRAEYLKRGYSLVYTPHVARRQLWQTSGHDGYYAENMFDVMELDDAEYRLKPMNCPFHILIYKDSLKSYRDLPVRFGEMGTVYRYERSGVMHGLLRVRGFTQDDAHIFCTPEQIESEIDGCLAFAFDVLKDFGFDKFHVELSTWNPNDAKNVIGSAEQWNRATASLENVLKARGMEYTDQPAGGCILWGPKIDVTSWSTQSADCGSFPRCNLTLPFRNVSARMRAEMAHVNSRSWCTARSTDRLSVSSAC